MLCVLESHRKDRHFAVFLSSERVRTLSCLELDQGNSNQLEANQQSRSGMMHFYKGEASIIINEGPI